MTKSLSALLAVAAIGFTAMTAPAHAELTRTWVSGTGSDLNQCTRSSPCLSFAGAILQTTAGGEIDCLDPGGYGNVTITKAVTIDCGGGDTGAVGSILSPNGVAITVQAGPNDVVTIRKLTINGESGSVTGGGTDGIRFLSGKSLEINNVNIMHFNTFGISMENTSGSSSLYVVNSTITDSGTASGGGNIFIDPVSGASAKVALKNVRMLGGTLGLKAIGTNAGTVKVSVDDTLATDSQNNGFFAQSTAAGGLVQMIINRSTASNNAGSGMHADGGNAQLFFGNSMVSGNEIGVSSVNGALLLSYGNNLIDQNTDNGFPVQGSSLN